MEKSKESRKKARLNPKEEAVLKAFGTKGVPVAISELAAASFAKRGTSAKTKGNSWVRNSLRRLLALGLVEQVPGEDGAVRSGYYMRTKTKISDLQGPKTNT